MYARFGGMIAVAMVVMYALTYVNSYDIGHVRWSETRFYMTLVMGAAMAVIMLSFMLHMLDSPRTNTAILAASLAVFTGALWLVRSQATIEDVAFMKAMIPHHSIAILTSERAGLKDLRVRKLADGIIEAQRREIQEMTWLIEDVQEYGPTESEAEAAARPVPRFGASEQE